MKQLRQILIGTGVMLALSVSGAAMASGSEGGGNAEIGNAAFYNMGKVVYATKLNCSGCPMAGKSLDAAAAKQLLAGQPKVNLSADEAKALGVFLTRRFRM